jgi:hypothetical protein
MLRDMLSRAGLVQQGPFLRINAKEQVLGFTLNWIRDRRADKFWLVLGSSYYVPFKLVPARGRHVQISVHEGTSTSVRCEFVWRAWCGLSWQRLTMTA